MKPNGSRRQQPAPMSPSAMIALGFLFFILFITFLLMLPLSSAQGAWTNPLTALFTATSAVCVTGLVVVDTATHWSLFGRVVLLCAIQIGGLGVMTVLGFASMMLGRRIGLRQRTLLQESIASMQIGGVVRLLRRAVAGTLIIEGAGALLLALRFVPLLGPVRGAGYAVFHAVSAFCNAGFDLMGTLSGPFTSLESFSADPLVNLTVMALILLGGLGFLVWDDLAEHRFCYKKLRLHTRIVLIMTLMLTIVPAALFLLFERSGAMADMDAGERILAALFSAVTPRTAGFDTIPTADLSPAGSMLTLLLMLIGGNPGSTAGGAKTTTLLLVLLLTVSVMRRREDVNLMGRRMEKDAVRRACAIVTLYLSLCFLAVLAICALQPALPVRDVLLEVFSALNTVGMSTGVTRQLAAPSLLVLIALMYIGRLGSLTFVLLLAGSPKSAPIQYPTDKLLVG